MQTKNNEVVYRVISLKPTHMKNHGQGNPEFYVYTHTHTHLQAHVHTLGHVVPAAKFLLNKFCEHFFFS